MSHRGRVGDFDAAAKRDQQRFRDSSPTIGDRARNASDDSGMRNLHLLALGCEEENLYPVIRGIGGAVDFFRERGIRWWKSPRSGDDTRRPGPTRNMTSSQVGCVNFLLPLAGIHAALLSAVRSIDDDICRIVDIRHEGRSTPVEFEWFGSGTSLEGGGQRGSHNTSVDAFLVAETVDGRLRAYLFEWKYAEHYLSARPDYKGEGRSGDTRRRRYADLYHASYSSFDTSVVPDMDEFLYEPFYQIMRQRLLADRMVRQGELGVDEAKVVIVVPERNWPYRSVAAAGMSASPPLAARFPHLNTVESVMRAALRDPAMQFDIVAPAAMLGAVHRDHPVETAPWASYWRERYGV